MTALLINLWSTQHLTARLSPIAWLADRLHLGHRSMSSSEQSSVLSELCQDVWTRTPFPITNAINTSPVHSHGASSLSKPVCTPPTRLCAAWGGKQSRNCWSIFTDGDTMTQGHADSYKATKSSRLRSSAQHYPFIHHLSTAAHTLTCWSLQRPAWPGGLTKPKLYPRHFSLGIIGL